jgi:hypothetical protein
MQLYVGAGVPRVLTAVTGGVEMTRRAHVLLLLGAVALVAPPAVLCAEAVPGDGVPVPIAETALSYSRALLGSDLTASWQLLSSKSRSEITAAEWGDALRPQPSPQPPSAQSLLTSLAGAEDPAEAGEVLIAPDQALVDVSNSVRITQELVLVKEGDRWLVDLSASDELNARAAAQLFLDAVRADLKVPSGAGASPSRDGRLSALQMLLAPQAKDYYVLAADVEEDRARVTLACDLPVHIVLRATRSAAGWRVDLSRPIVSVDPTSAAPLSEAMDSAHSATCQEQLRQLGRAFAMYMAASDDLLPDPDRWVEMVRPFGAAGISLHCPSDPSPGISYAMNRNLAGKRRSEIANPSRTPLLFESTLHTNNASDTGESWPEPALHAGGNLVLYVDGSVGLAKVKPSFEVREGRAGAGAVRPQPRRTPPGRPRRQPL